MSASEISSQSHPPNTQNCAFCGVVLPFTAVFCGKCGERTEKSIQYTKDVSSSSGLLSLDHYRIISLIRRISYVQLSLAIDTQQKRPVVIRDIDIQKIDMSKHSRIFRALQQEYDLLRRQNINSVLPLVASFYEQNHLYSVATWPTTALPPKSGEEQAPHIYTLQDLMQSGIGLPDEQIVLNWTLRLANAIEHLHRNNIVIGTLEPSTVLVNQKDYSGQPTLFPSWMLPGVQQQLQQSLNAANTSPLATDRAAFFSPEARQGQFEMRSDIYSIAAILYLLVTGIAPTEPSRTLLQPVRSPREINPRIQSTLAEAILKALSIDPSARFQSVNEFAAALQGQQGQRKVFPSLSLSHNPSLEKASTDPEEINVSSSEDNNKTEQRKAVYPDDTISTVPMQNESVGRDQQFAVTQKLRVKQLHPANKKTIVEDGHRAEKDIVGTSSTKQENLSLPENESGNTSPPNTNEPKYSVTIPTNIANSPSSDDNTVDTRLPPMPPQTQPDEGESATPSKFFPALLELIKQFLLGGQPRPNHAVAMIETPMRIQPNKNYAIRIHLIGRNEPKHAHAFKQSHESGGHSGLGSLVHGDIVHIEVRSALYHNYAYIVQQTDVEVPAHNYAAEVTIPMRSMTDSSGTKRERLHIFFTDEKRNPLYEKPFIIELFISNLVQSGNEGHNVLSVPQ